MNKLRITYTDLVTSFGKDSAFYILRSIERMAEIQHEIVSMDCDARLQTALDALNEIDFAVRH